MNDNFFDVLFPIFLLIAVVGFIGWLLLRIKKSGKSMITTIHGAMYETYNKEKRASVEQVLEQKVNKMNEQKSDNPID